MSEFTLKIKLPGYKLCLFSLHPHTLELSFGHFQTLKDQGYQKFTQKIDDFDIAETPKMSVFEQKKPTVLWFDFSKQSRKIVVSAITQYELIFSSIVPDPLFDLKKWLTHYIFVKGLCLNKNQ